jgi:dynein heavy chain
VLALAKDVAARIPQAFNVEDAMAKFPITYHNSMNTVLIQELLRYNKLVVIVHKQLSQLQKALKGEVVMSEDLLKVNNAFYDNKIPAPWMKKSFPSLKPLGAYVNDLIARLNFLNTWIESGEPAVYWLSGFFFTQSFLTGVMQNYARKKEIEIDTLVWDYTVMRESTFAQQPEDGCYINGLYLEGAAWDPVAGTLCESLPKVLYVEFPIVYLRPCLAKEVKKGNFYECPLYKTLERRGVLATTGHSSNFVMVFQVPRAQETPEDHWVIRGTAMFTQLDYKRELFIVFLFVVSCFKFYGGGHVLNSVVLLRCNVLFFKLVPKEFTLFLFTFLPTLTTRVFDQPAYVTFLCPSWFDAIFLAQVRNQQQPRQQQPSPIWRPPLL